MKKKHADFICFQCDMLKFIFSQILHKWLQQIIGIKGICTQSMNQGDNYKARSTIDKKYRWNQCKLPQECFSWYNNSKMHCNLLTSVTDDQNKGPHDSVLHLFDMYIYHKQRTLWFLCSATLHICIYLPSKSIHRMVLKICFTQNYVPTNRQNGYYCLPAFWKHKI